MFWKLVNVLGLVTIWIIGVWTLATGLPYVGASYLNDWEALAYLISLAAAFCFVTFGIARLILSVIREKRHNV